MSQNGAPTRQATLLDGRAVAEEIIRILGQRLAKAGSPVTLATVLVGDNAPSRLYVGMKQRAAAQAGIRSRHVELPGSTSQDALEQQIRLLADDPQVNGILIQLPLPPGLDADKLIDLVPPEKDVDGLTERNMGRLLRGKGELVPCTPLGVMRLIEHYGIKTRGARAVVIGRSALVGLPMLLLLAARGVDATVTLAHSRSADIAVATREADIVVAAAGLAGLIGAEHVKPGAAVFDVGVSRTAQGIRGDVRFDEVSKVAGWITPMPGGTGPMTVACLLENTVRAAQLQGALPSG